MHERISNVTGLDLDAAVPDSARGEDGGVTWLQGDVMTYPFRPASFDVVASVATIHHLPNLDRHSRPIFCTTLPGW